MIWDSNSITPEPYAEIGNCFHSVEEKIRRNGGKQILGWQIWKNQFFIEAEFHAIWESPNGDLKDITPKQIDSKNILFLPDEKLKYNNISKDNIRLNITKNHLIDDLIKIYETEFIILNKGKRTFEYGAIILNKEEESLYMFLENMKNFLLLMVTKGLNKNSLCFCNSGKKYKYCHGYKL